MIATERERVRRQSGGWIIWGKSGVGARKEVSLCFCVLYASPGCGGERHRFRKVTVIGRRRQEPEGNTACVFRLMSLDLMLWQGEHAVERNLNVFLVKRSGSYGRREVEYRNEDGCSWCGFDSQ